MTSRERPPGGWGGEPLTLDLGPDLTPAPPKPMPARPAPPAPPAPARAPAPAPAPPRAAAPARAPSRLDAVVAHVDGGARGNPGPAGIGAVLAAPDGTVLEEISEGIGWATNNVAEYKALIAALRGAKDLGARQLTVKADSKLVVEQMRGAWKVKNPDLQQLWEEARRLARGFDRVAYQHVRRERNKAADALANRAMDAQGRVSRRG